MSEVARRSSRLDRTTRSINAWKQRFGAPHLSFAMHAAIPIALAPELGYRLWAAFRTDGRGQSLDVPWIAVADLLLSDLCQEVGPELYEMRADVRIALLGALRGEPRFGSDRIAEVAEFLREQSEGGLAADDPMVRSVAQSQYWTALAYARPAEAAALVASALAEIPRDDHLSWVRLTSLLSALSEPLAPFSPLLALAPAMVAHGHGDGALLEQFVEEYGWAPEVAGVRLAVPAQVLPEFSPAQGGVPAAWAAPGHPRRPRVELAAYLGDPRARTLLGADAPAAPATLDAWIGGLRRFGLVILARAALAAASRAMSAATASAATAMEALASAELCLRLRSPEAARAARGQVASIATEAASVAAAVAAASSPFETDEPAGDLTTEHTRAAARAAALVVGESAVQEAVREALLPHATSDPSDVPPLWRPTGRLVMIVGTGSYKVDEMTEWATGEVGRALAIERYRLVTGGFQGVDHIAARAYAREIELVGASTLGNLQHVVARGMLPDFAVGDTLEVEPGTEIAKRLMESDAVVGIGGFEVAYAILSQAAAAGMRVVPLPWTDGAARRAHHDLLAASSRGASSLSRRELQFLEGQPRFRSDVGFLVDRAMLVLDLGTTATQQAFAATVFDFLMAVDPLRLDHASPALRAYVDELLDAMRPRSEEGATTSSAFALAWDRPALDVARSIQALEAHLPGMAPWLVYDFTRIEELSLGWPPADVALEHLVPLLARHADHLARDVIGRAFDVGAAALDVAPSLDAPRLQWLKIAAKSMTSAGAYQRWIQEIAIRWAKSYLAPRSSMDVSDGIAEAILLALRALDFVPEPEFIRPLSTSAYAAERVVSYLLWHAAELRVPAAEIAAALGAELLHAETNRETRPLWQLLVCCEVLPGLEQGGGGRRLAAELREAVRFLGERRNLDPGGECKTQIDMMLGGRFLAATFMLNQLDRLARNYEDLRRSPGGEKRTAAMDALVNTAADFANAQGLTPDEVNARFARGADGDRVVALSALIAAPLPSCFEIVQRSIDELRSPFEQYTALRAANAMLPRLDKDPLRSLQRALLHQRSRKRGKGIDKSDSPRWHLSKNLLDRIELALGQAPTGHRSSETALRGAPSQARPNDGRTLFRWLHLSDLHVGHGDIDHGWDQKLVMHELRRDVAEMVKRTLHPIDAVLVTGDIAFSGAGRSPSEYDEVRAWLGELGAAAGVGPTEIFVVPGNHDVNRAVDNDPAVRRLVVGLRNGRDKLDFALSDAGDRKLLASRMQAYLAFSAGAAPACQSTAIAAAEDRLFWVHRMPTDADLKVRLVGLNTALLSADDQDHGKLQVGKEQLDKALTDPPIEDGELVMVLSHHPLLDGWLADEEHASLMVHNFAHVLLSGHAHTVNMAAARVGGGGGVVRIVAGLAHNDKSAPGVPPGYGYSFGEVRGLDDGSVRLQVWPRKWSPRRAAFTLDAANVQGSEELRRARAPVKGPME